METLWPVLQAKLEVAEDAEVATQQRTFTSFRPADHVAERIETLERLKDREKQTSKTPELEASVEALQTQLADCKASIESCTNLAQYIGQQITALEPTTTQSSEKPTKASVAKNIPETDDHLADLRQQLDSQNQQLATHLSNQQQIVDDLTQTQSLLGTERNRVTIALSSIDQSVGRWKAFEDLSLIHIPSPRD